MKPVRHALNGFQNGIKSTLKLARNSGKLACLTKYENQPNIIKATNIIAEIFFAV